MKLRKDKLMGTKGTVRTDIFIVTYSSNAINKLLKELKSKYNVIKFTRSSILNEFYYISLEGRAKDLEKVLTSLNDIVWYKIDYVEFK